jgi:hypothetical protein
MNDDNQSQQPSYIQQKPNGKRLVIIFCIIGILVLICLVGLYMLGNMQRTTQKAKSPTATQTAMKEPREMPTAIVSKEPTSAPIDKETLSITVLNGSGTVGAAQKVAKMLTASGYTKVKTGNADNFAYQGITIVVKKNANDISNLLKQDLKESDPKTTVTTTIDNTIETDAEIIIGQ